jgi:glycosyltransferase involved in cell wall biosynthesis
MSKAIKGRFFRHRKLESRFVLAGLKNVSKVELSISAIIPVFNGKKSLKQAVSSIVAQTLQPIELILIDDGSTDDSLSVIDLDSLPFPVVVFRQENGGQSRARNQGAAFAKGKYLAFLDQDDLWYPDHLQKLSAAILAQSSTGWAYSNVDEIDGNGELVTLELLNDFPSTHPKKSLKDLLSNDMLILPSAALILKQAFDDIGGFDERLSGYEDDDLFLRIFRKGYRNVYVKESLSQFRIHPESSTFSTRMSDSRRIYSNKLITQFPDDPRLLRYWVRDVIAPRFLRDSLNEFILGIETRDGVRIKRAMQDLSDHRKLTGREKRWKGKFAMQIWLFLARVSALSQFLSRGSRPKADTLVLEGPIEPTFVQSAINLANDVPKTNQVALDSSADKPLADRLAAISG